MIIGDGFRLLTESSKERGEEAFVISKDTPCLNSGADVEEVDIMGEYGGGGGKDV